MFSLMDLLLRAKILYQPFPPKLLNLGQFIKLIQFKTIWIFIKEIQEKSGYEKKRRKL